MLNRIISLNNYPWNYVFKQMINTNKIIHVRLEYLKSFNCV